MRHERSERHMGTQVDIAVVSDQAGVLDDIERVFRIFSDIESEFSRFLPDSPLSILNATKHLDASDRFIGVLKTAIAMHGITDGRFNPLVSVAELGYTRSFEEGIFQSSGEKPDTDIQKIQITGNHVNLAENQSLDFGGIVKGFAVDAATIFLQDSGYTNFFVNAGGDIYTSGVNETGLPWGIGIENPKNLGVLAKISLSGMSIATSGGYRRKWHTEGGNRHHLINPIVGGNSAFFQSVTIIASRCMIADALTKSVFNLPSEEALWFLQKHAIDGVLIGMDDRIHLTPGFTKKYDFTSLFV